MNPPSQLSSSFRRKRIVWLFLMNVILFLKSKDWRHGFLNIFWRYPCSFFRFLKILLRIERFSNNEKRYAARHTFFRIDKLSFQIIFYKEISASALVFLLQISKNIPSISRLRFFQSWKRKNGRYLTASQSPVGYILLRCISHTAFWAPVSPRSEERREERVCQYV